MKDKNIAIDAEHPEADVRHIVKGIVRKSLKAVPPKAAISLRIDREVLDWFRAQGTGYQSRMNAVLKAFKEESAERGHRRRDAGRRHLASPRAAGGR